MIKGLDSKLRDLKVTGTKNGIYHGRTELGVGEHDKIKKRLDEERHQDYRNHMARKEMERRASKAGYGDSPPAREGSIGSVCDIGYETSMSIAHQRKQLNEARKAEYVAHLAARSASIQTDRHDGSNAYTQTAQAKQQDDYTNTVQQSQAEQVQDDRKQKQRDYAEALRQQIAEKKKTTDKIRRKEKEEDRKNMEMAQGSSQGFSYGSYSQRNNYDGQTTDQIRLKEREDDRKNMEMAQGSSQGDGSYSHSNNYDGQTPDRIRRNDDRKYLEMVRRSNQGDGSYSQDSNATQDRSGGASCPGILVWLSCEDIYNGKHKGGTPGGTTGLPVANRCPGTRIDRQRFRATASAGGDTLRGEGQQVTSFSPQYRCPDRKERKTTTNAQLKYFRKFGCGSHPPTQHPHPNHTIVKTVV